MKYINITNADIIQSMNNDTKHNFANYCIVNGVEPENVLEPIKNVINGVVNLSIKLCNEYFETPAGKEYLKMLEKIEKIGYR